MPRTSPFPIHLSSAEAVELRRRSAKDTLPYFQVQRANIVWWPAEGWHNSEIAVRLGPRRDVVSEWRKRFFVERLAGLEERARPGRPRTFPPELVVQVKAWACELPALHQLPLSRWSTTDLVRQLCQTGLVASIHGRQRLGVVYRAAIR